jgi:hypothetical protein
VDACSSLNLHLSNSGNSFLLYPCTFQVVSVQELELEWQTSRSHRNFSADNVLVQDDMVRDIAVKWGCFIIGRKYFRDLYLLEYIWSFRSVLCAVIHSPQLGC